MPRLKKRSDESLFMQCLLPPGRLNKQAVQIIEEDVHMDTYTQSLHGEVTLRLNDFSKLRTQCGGDLCLTSKPFEVGGHVFEIKIFPSGSSLHAAACADASNNKTPVPAPPAPAQEPSVPAPQHNPPTPATARKATMLAAAQQMADGFKPSAEVKAAGAGGPTSDRKHKAETEAVQAPPSKKKSQQKKPPASVIPQPKKKTKKQKKADRIEAGTMGAYIQRRLVKRERKELGKLTQLMQRQRHHERLQRRYEQAMQHNNVRPEAVGAMPATKAMWKVDRAVKKLKHRLRLPDVTDRETTERLLKSKTQMHNMLVAAVNTASKQKSAQEQQQQQFQSALRAAKREANKHPETRQQPKLDAPEAVHKTPASKPRTHKFLGQAISISIVHKGVSGSVSPRGICVSETDYAEYIRTAHRFWVGDWVQGAQSEHPDEPAVWVELGPRAPEVKKPPQAPTAAHGAGAFGAPPRPAGAAAAAAAVAPAQHDLSQKELERQCDFFKAVRMDMDAGSRFKAYTIRKALQHCDILATDKGHTYLKDDALTLRISVDVLCINSCTEPRFQVVKKPDGEAPQLSEALEAQIHAAHMADAAAPLRAEDEEPTAEAVLMHKATVPGPTPCSLAKDMRALLLGKLPSFEGPEAAPYLAIAGDPLLQPDGQTYLRVKGQFNADTGHTSPEVMFNIHSFMVDGRSGFLTAGLGFKHLRDEQQAQHGGVPVVETDEHPEVVRAALHWLYTDELPKSWCRPDVPQDQKTAMYTKLFELASEWDMPGLLQHMQKAICGAMTPDTAVYLLMKAELMRHLCHSESCPCKTSVTGVHHFLHLKSYAMRFIALTLPESYSRAADVWPSVYDRCPVLLWDLIHAVLESGVHMASDAFKSLVDDRMKHFPLPQDQTPKFEGTKKDREAAKREWEEKGKRNLLLCQGKDPDEEEKKEEDAKKKAEEEKKKAEAAAQAAKDAAAKGAAAQAAKDEAAKDEAMEDAAAEDVRMEDAAAEAAAAAAEAAAAEAAAAEAAAAEVAAAALAADMA